MNAVTHPSATGYTHSNTAAPQVGSSTKQTNDSTGAQAMEPAPPPSFIRSTSDATSPMEMDPPKGLKPVPPGTKVTVIGGGSFGLAMASIPARKGIPTTVLLRKQEDADHINTHRRHPQHLSDMTLSEHITASADPKTAFEGASYIIHAIPVQFSRAYLQQIAPFVPKDVPVISTSKGIEKGTLAMMDSILLDTLGARELAFLSGPSFAREILLEQCTCVVVASDSEALANEVCDLMSSHYVRVFTSGDVLGVEVGGAVKNVIAIAAGMCEGLGLGMNAAAALVTRGCNEVQRLALYMGARPSTLTGLSGVGDCFATCFGPLSRNRTLGVRVGKGESIQDILDSLTEVAEGYATTFSLCELINKTNAPHRRERTFPIIYTLKSILEGSLAPADGVKRLMSTPGRVELWNM